MSKESGSVSAKSDINQPRRSHARLVPALLWARCPVACCPTWPRAWLSDTTHCGAVRATPGCLFDLGCRAKACSEREGRRGIVLLRPSSSARSAHHLDIPRALILDLPQGALYRNILELQGAASHICIEPLAPTTGTLFNDTLYAFLAQSLRRKLLKEPWRWAEGTAHSDAGRVMAPLAGLVERLRGEVTELQGRWEALGEELEAKRRRLRLAEATMELMQLRQEEAVHLEEERPGGGGAMTAELEEDVSQAAQASVGGEPAERLICLVIVLYVEMLCI
jgi:hypothetical protein